MTGNDAANPLPAGKRVPAKMVSLAEDGFYYCAGELFTGTAYTEYPNGAPRSESEYRGGLAWGKSQGWYKNGTLAAESKFFRDVQHGVAREWSAAGCLVSEIVAEYGITVQERKWDDQGNLLEEYRLAESDPDYQALLAARQRYGSEDPAG